MRVRVWSLIRISVDREKGGMEVRRAWVGRTTACPPPDGHASRAVATSYKLEASDFNRVRMLATGPEMISHNSGGGQSSEGGGRETTTRGA